MNRFYSSILAGVILLSGNTPASACACVARSEAEQIARNNIVVKGEVISVKTSTRLGRKVVIARIKIENVEKGAARSYVNVEAYDYPGQCAVMFKLNEPMRFAAMKSGTSYRTNICRILPLPA